MVGTRKSTKSATNDDDSALLASLGDQKRDRLLKELRIDAEDGLRDRKVKKRDGEKGVYYWKGVAYAITDDTPQEWIDQGKKSRYEKNAPENIPAPTKDVVEEQQQPVEEKKDDISKKRPAEDDEEEQQQQPAKKMRSSMPDISTMTRVERQAAGVWTPLKELKKQKKSKPAAPAPEIQEQQQQEDDDLLPEIVVKSPPPPQSESTRPVAKTPSPPPPPSAPRTLSVLERLSSQIEARQFAFDIAKMGKLNSRIANVSDEIQASSEPGLEKLQALLADDWPTGSASPSTDATPSLPDTNKAGQRVRWSINQEEMMRNPDRAESAIVKGRLEGESKAARRRRVKRELEFVKTLPLAND